jgi:hypothetical protein
MRKVNLKRHKQELIQKILGIHPSLFCVAKAMQNKKSYGGQVNPGQAGTDQQICQTVRS